MSIEISQLASGLRVATDTMPESESVVIGVWVDVGTRHEPWRANGVAHLVEHMMFKGTKTRSSYALSSAIENKGGGTNAHTTREETAYYARVLPEDAELACDVIADMLKNSVFDERELDRERQVIIQEIGRDLDSPEDHVFDLMHSLAFPKQKMGRSILGTADVIARLPRDAILDHTKYYNAETMVVVASGKIEHKQFVEMTKRHFNRIPAGRKPRIEKARVGSGSIVTKKEIEQLHWILGFPAPGMGSKAVYPMQLLSLILGGSASSRLFQKVREKRGLVYTISSAHSAYTDSGLFQIYAGTDPERVSELVRVVCEELRDVTQNITQGELARAKAQIRADLLMGQESVMRRAEVLGHQILFYNRKIPTEEILSRLMAVTKEDVEAMAGKLIRRKPLMTALGPTDQLEPYKDIVSKLAG